MEQTLWELLSAPFFAAVIRATKGWNDWSRDGSGLDVYTISSNIYIYIYLLIYLFIIYGLMFVYTVYIYIYMICWYQAERYQLQHECRSTAAKNSAFVTYRHQPAADSVAIYGESVEAAWCKLNTVCFLRHVLLNILHCFTYFQAFKLFSRGSAPFL